MSDAIKEVERFAKDRLIDEMDYDALNYATNVIEELFEGNFVKISKDRRAKLKERVRAFFITTIEEMELELEDYTEEEKEYETADYICDILVFSLTEVMKLGYNPECALLETAKEINSRQQDPKQKEAWNKDPKLKAKQKWQKNELQKPETLYKADYSKCKVKS
jgi:hypothetical protein